MNPSTPLKTTESNDADNKPWRATLLSAAIISMAGLGDSFLYPALPLHADQLGVPVIWIGVLLSINKFVRLGGNYGVALGIGLLGYKRIAAVSVALAALDDSFIRCGPADLYLDFLSASLGNGLRFPSNVRSRLRHR